MGPEFRKNRDSWVQAVRLVNFSKEEELAVKAGPDPKDQEGDYFEPAGDLAGTVLTVEAEQDLFSVQEQLQLQAALLHPSLRSQHEHTLAALALTTSQAPKTSKHPDAPKETRAEKVARWRAALGSGSIAARLAELVPASGRKTAAKKKLKKALLGEDRHEVEGSQATPQDSKGSWPES
jgi:murein L,D-transpeptidase YcbB/YkuD